MQFVIRAIDGEGMLAKRLEVRPRHLEGMAALGRHIVCAGGLLDAEGKMKGSVIVVEFPSREDVSEYISHEPYFVEHVWEKIEVEPINIALVKGEKYVYEP